MSATPLLAIRCPSELKTRLEYEAKTSGQSVTRLVLDRIKSGLPSLPLIERKSLPPVACVYFVVGQSNKLLYIGQTQDLLKRWNNHHRLGQLLGIDPECRIAWLEVDDRVAVESSLIEELSPELNGTEGENGFSTTDKTKISAYLDSQDNETLEALAAKHRISKSQVVIMAIRALANSDNVELRPSAKLAPSNGVTLEQVESVIKAAITPLSREIDQLKKPELVA
ncbi:GIY-YIG nuclease family protein (plasmid) [Synechocystis sp. B12]|nr:GIY-YIG nuclease family protein [Synechocystis sp. B12]